MTSGPGEIVEVDAVPMADTKCHSDASQSQVEIITRAQMETTVQSGTTARPDADTVPFHVLEASHI